jgi:hypothetical protein
MNSATLQQIIDEQLDRCMRTLSTKAGEYATADRLHHFRVAATMQGITPAQALAGMMAKHTVSIYDMCNSAKDYPIAQWNEKITDHINYLLLLAAAVRDEKDGVV